MALQVLIGQPAGKSTELLTNFFKEWGDEVSLATTAAEAHSLLEKNEPELVVVDLHLLNNGWKELLPEVRQRFPETKILFTSSYPDPQQETYAKEQYGARVFLRQPFTRAGVEEAIRVLEGSTPIGQDTSPRVTLPKVRVPVRIKITFPYLALALVLALAAAYVVSRVVLDTIEERFTNQLIEAGKLTNDWLVNEEDRLLETLRLLAHTRGVPEAVAAGDAERLRELALPVAINYQEEAVEILDRQGISMLSLRHRSNGNMEDYSASRGEVIFSQWGFVQPALEHRIENGRDKYAGLARAPWGDYFYVVGPIVDDAGSQVGVIMIGKSLPTLANQIRQDTLAHTTFYDFNGRPIASTFLLFGKEAHFLTPEHVSGILEPRENPTLIRPLAVASINYSEIVGPWQVHEFLGSMDVPRSDNSLGLIGVALAHTFLARPSQITRLQIFALTAGAFVLVIALGVVLANRITRPLLRVVAASAEVAQGNLEVRVDSGGDDEVAVLAHSFNQMVSGLKEGSLYRDLLGRTVSPQVREELRQGFASGELRLEGQEAVATVLVSDIRGFTTLSEAKEPTTVLNWLNEYFGEIVPIITNHGGIISKFEGDAVLAFFGILPRLLSAQDSAYRACQTALAMLDAVTRLNARRAMRGEPLFTAGIGINTGPVTAGGLGSTDRLHYTIIGDAVNTTARLENLTRQFGEESSAVVSQHTLFALRERRHEFELEPLGAHTVKGKAEQLLVYRLKPAKVKA